MMDTKGDRCLNCKIKSEVVALLNKEELGMLESGCGQVHFNKGELLVKEGAPARFIIYIRDGFVKLGKSGVGGKDFILSISKKGAYLNIQNLNRKSKIYYFSATALTDTNVCFIDINNFELLLKSNGVFATEVISYIFSDEMNYFDRLVNNVQQQLPGRLANTLLYFRDEVYNQNPFNLNVTKSELASLIGTSRESVTRLLKEFQLSGMIKAEKDKITILDEKKLEEIKQKG
jgi:CRP/FNR family transcriptional regulator